MKIFWLFAAISILLAVFSGILFKKKKKYKEQNYLDYLIISVVFILVTLFCLYAAIFK